jgi:hypothetical protein
MPPVQWIRELFLGIKWPGREADHSPPSNVEVKNEWSFTFMLPMCLHDLHREENSTLKSLEINCVGILHGMLWAKLSRISDLVHNVPELRGLPSRILSGTVSQHTLFCKESTVKYSGASRSVGLLNDE